MKTKTLLSTLGTIGILLTTDSVSHAAYRDFDLTCKGAVYSYYLNIQENQQGQKVTSSILEISVGNSPNVQSNIESRVVSVYEAKEIAKASSFELPPTAYVFNSGNEYSQSRLATVKAARGGGKTFLLIAIAGGSIERLNCEEKSSYERAKAGFLPTY